MRVTVYVPDAVGKEAAKLARDRGVSVSSLYAEVMAAYIKEERRKEAFERIDSLIGTTYVAPDFDEQLDDLRRDDLERV